MPRVKPEGTSISCFIFTSSPEPDFLILKRNERLGGFWQPISGFAERGESPLDAVYREVKEETGLDEFRQTIDLDYFYTFERDGVQYREHCYALEIDTPTEITLSGEHTDYKWDHYQIALDTLPFQAYKRALKILNGLLTKAKDAPLPPPGS